MLDIVAIIAYFLGSLPFGVILSRLNGVDILSIGSGNPGFTNVLRNLGVKVGAMVLILDMLKGTLATFLGSYLAGEWGMLVGFSCALVGHSLSPFIHFRGGKGIATGAGGLLFISPLTFLLSALTVVVPAILTKYMSLGAILSALGTPIYLYLTGESWRVVGMVGLLSCYVIFLHRSNIVRLLKGEENKISLGKRD